MLIVTASLSQAFESQLSNKHNIRHSPNCKAKSYKQKNMWLQPH